MPQTGLKLGLALMDLILYKIMVLLTTQEIVDRKILMG